MDSKSLGGGACPRCGSGTGWKYVACALILLQLGLTVFWVAGNDGNSKSWLWPAIGRGVLPLPSNLGDGVSLAVVRQELEAALSESETRLAGRLGVGANTAPPARTDVTRLLQLEGLSDEERRALEELQYFRKFPNASRKLHPSEHLPPWVPHKDRFLLPICNYGQISNRLVCMRNAMLLALLLNRTLLVPEAEPEGGGYPYWLVFDVPHARSCIGDIGNPTMMIMTLEEYLAMTVKPGQPLTDVKLKVDKLLGFFHWFDVKDYQLVWGPNSAVQLPETRESLPTGMRRVASAADWIQLAGGLQERVISPGDLFKLFFEMPRWLDLPASVYDRANLPLRGLSCRMLVQPHPAIVTAAKGFVRSLLGPDYLAIHLRRGDFLAYWNDKNCQPAGEANRLCRIRPLQVLAGCIREKLVGTNISVVFAATNAFPIELELLSSALAPVILVRAPSSYKHQPFPWAQQWNAMKLDSKPLALVAQDKLVCAMSRIFMGTSGSTFTTDIVAMRAALGTDSSEDHDLCGSFRYDIDPLPFFNLTDPRFKRPFR